MQEKKAGGRFEAERKITTSDGEGTFENGGARGMRETMTEALDCGGSYHYDITTPFHDIMRH